MYKRLSKENLTYIGKDYISRNHSISNGYTPLCLMALREKENIKTHYKTLED